MTHSALPLVILDRDGVINEDSDAFVKSPEEWQPIAGSIEAIAKLCQAGYQVVIATNQSGIGRELFTVETLEQIHAKMHQYVEDAGGTIAGIFYCPHLPDDACDCRKPLAGLLDELIEQFDLLPANPPSSKNTVLQGVPFVGDSLRDLQAGLARQCQPVLVLTGKGKKTQKQLAETPINFSPSLKVYADLAHFVDDFLALPAEQ